MADARKNFAVSTVATPPSPAASGTSLIVTAGHGGRFPTPPFNAIVCPSGSIPDPSNAEIVRVTAISTDTLTVTRAQEGSAARSIVAGDMIFAGPTAKMIDDLDTRYLFVPLVPNSSFTNLPAAVGFWTNSAGNQFGQKVDLTNYKQVRLTVNKQSTAGSAGSKVVLRYSTTFSTTAGTYLDIGTSEVAVAVDTSTVQILDTGWINLAAGAKADVVIMPLGYGGDGVADPNFGWVSAQFR